jgi:spore coat polysaccharide biosynthesis predicted glycosyltransferase SpsG
VYVQTPKMAQLIAGADVGIGAGGSTIWERCCLGLPTITVAVADHQEPYCKRLSEIGYISYAGSAMEGSLDYVAALQEFLQNPEKRRKMSRLGMDLVDGRGVSRVVESMLR